MLIPFQVTILDVSCWFIVNFSLLVLLEVCNCTCSLNILVSEQVNSEFSDRLSISFLRNLRSHKLDILNRPGVYGGAIILCNHVTKLESFRQRLFALPEYATSFIRKIRAGMLLFVFEREERKLCGLFEATSDGALNILPSAFPSRRKSKRAQVRFRRVWFCKPLTEAEFSDAIKGLEPHVFSWYIIPAGFKSCAPVFSKEDQPGALPETKIKSYMGLQCLSGSCWTRVQFTHS